MKTMIAGAVLVALMSGSAALADGFEGFKAGAEIGAVSTRYTDTFPSLGGSRVIRTGKGLEYRAFAGYDAALSDKWLVGTEVGLAGGRKTARKSVSAGKVAFDPGLSWDVSARLGYTPSDDLLLYGRAGYQWVKVTEIVTPTASTTAIRKKTTEGAPLIGLGAEYRVAEGVALRGEFDFAGFDDKKTRDKSFKVGVSFQF